MFFTWDLIQNALELGLIYGLVALALFKYMIHISEHTIPEVIRY